MFEISKNPPKRLSREPVQFLLQLLQNKKPIRLSSVKIIRCLSPLRSQSDGRGEGQGEVRVLGELHTSKIGCTLGREAFYGKVRPPASSLSPQRGEGLRVRGEKIARLSNLQ
jgi:hypothetical protein